MSYNRWMPVQCSSELYHHGVKGMKWGKHLFGKATELLSGGGGGAAEEDPELADLIEKFKKGLISREALLKAKQALDAKRLKDKIGLTTREDLKSQEAYRKEFDLRNYNVRDDTTPFGKSTKKEREESNRKINELREEYSKTPLGKVEGAVSKGANKVKQALRKREQEKNADTRQFAAHGERKPKTAKEAYDNALQKALKEEQKQYEENQRQREEKAKAWRREHDDYLHAEYVAEKKEKYKLEREKKKYQKLLDDAEKIRKIHNEFHPEDQEAPARRPRTRKRNVTAKGTEVHLYGPVSNYWRKK